MQFLQGLNKYIIERIQKTLLYMLTESLITAANIDF